ncbi:MAG TPA: polysaccharide deacetylase family protein [Blastocatellia bacterium]|nr:polysaccharide deacetylase family protein [Blastocatellia bacterium]
MLTIKLAPGFVPEQRYILSVLLEEFLGACFAIEGAPSGGPFVSISAEGKTLVLEQTLFCGSDARLTSADSLPSRPLPLLDPEREGLNRDLFCDQVLPVIYGAPGPEGNWITRSPDKIVVHADILGSSFFMLSRLEENIKCDRDTHGRFPYTASLAYQEGFLDRPIVNEYLELLWSAMQLLWPNLERKQRSFRLGLSHDLDRPFSYQPFQPAGWLRPVAGDLLKRHKPVRALSGLINGGLAVAGLPHEDPLDTFDWLMEKSEAAGTASTFYFMAGGDTEYDTGYSLKGKRIRRLAREIADRGHEIGLHPSYSTLSDGALLKTEASALERLLDIEGIAQPRLGGRQHYLRWEAPLTWQIYEDAGLTDDSSVGYAGRAGFRCGVCYDYPVFNILTRQQLELVERPLLIMEATLFREEYMNLDHESATGMVSRIKLNVERYRGVFRLLWHNSWFARGDCERRFYEWAISR